MSYTKAVRPGASPLGALRDVHRWGRQTGAHKISLLSQTYEKPTIRRNRIAEERAYYAKWFYLKYATEVIKYSFKNHLLLAPPFDMEDEQRLTSLREKGFFTAAEAQAKLKQIEIEMDVAEAAIKAMDAFSPITAAKRVPTASLFTPASRVMSEIEKNRGVIPPLSALRKRLEGRGWTGEETAALRAQLVTWSELRLERQKLRDIVAADEGRAAKWACGYSNAELKRLIFERKGTKAAAGKVRPL